MTPTHSAPAATARAIRFAVGECSLGSILVAATRQGRLRDPARRRSRCAGARPAGPLSEGAADRRRRRLRAAGGARSSASSRRRRWASICRSTSAAPRSSSASGRRCGTIPAGTTASYAEIAAAHRRAEGGARGGAGLRVEPARGRHPLPPRGAHRRRAVGLSLGRRAQARAARAGGRRHDRAETAGAQRAPASPALAARVAALDWAAHRRRARRARLRHRRALLTPERMRGARRAL